MQGYYTDYIPVIQYHRRKVRIFREIYSFGRKISAKYSAINHCPLLVDIKHWLGEWQV